MSSSKQYGLQLSKKNSTGVVQKHSVFGDDSDSDKSDGGGTDWKKRALKSTEKSTVKHQTKVEMQRALEEDSSVYQYDEIYDQMQKSKQDKSSREKERKPKYIEKLMAAAEKRKIENERRVERQVQKEREAEGDEFKDKETFVTSAYKKKLEEFAKLDAEQKRQDMLEEIGDVTKQQDMGGFYRHLYQTTVDGGKEGSPSKKDSGKKEGANTPKNDKTTAINSKENSKERSPVKTPKVERETNPIKKIDSKKDSRKYRKRKESESSVEKNKDADTDVSSSSSSSGSGSESGEAKSSQSETENPKRLLSKRTSTEHPAASGPVLASDSIQQTRPKTPEPQVNIWEKRTVGPIFDAALKRYLERKNSRLAAAS